MPLDQNPHQTVTRFGCVGFLMYSCGFSVCQMRQFCLFTRSWLKSCNDHQIAVPRGPNDISSAADNAIFKKSPQNIECSLGCVARSTVLLKPNVANILLFSFCEQKFFHHGPITIAIDCNGLFLLIFDEKWSNYASGPKFAPNSASFWMRRFLNVCVQFFCAPNARILSFIWKDDFFFAKIGIFCKSIAGQVPSVVQAYMQPYSFGGGI